MAGAKCKMVSAVFRDRANAQKAFEWLCGRGYRSEDVNVLMSDATRARYFPSHEEGRLGTASAAAEGATVGGAIGTAIGATLAAVAAIGPTLAVPGLGLVIAGPIAAALAGAGVGAVTGGILGALIGWGIPEPNARAYEQALREGGVVIGVCPLTDEEGAVIKQYFLDHNGENVYYG
jgi:hypothetical protein